MVAEGAIAIGAGIAAGSIALIGFGIDSAIEGFASAIIVWRFTGHRIFSEAAETRAQKLVALQFFLLAPYVGFESVQALATGERPGVSWLALFGAWRLDPLVGLVIAGVAVKEGVEAWRGEGCACVVHPMAVSDECCARSSAEQAPDRIQHRG